jgi:hypothetical protein
MIVWQRWVGIGLMLCLTQRWILPLLLLAKDVDGVLQFYEPGTFPVNVLPSSFDVLGGCLFSHDGLLFLSEPFYF